MMQQGGTSTFPLADQAYRRDLGDGLLLRWSTPGDVELLVALFCDVFRPGDDAPPERYWVRDMMGGCHPHITAYDFALVEDTVIGKVVAATGLFANKVSYEDIPFTLGRAVIVATEGAYRNRGLQRAIFGLIHARSAARGHLAQGITGIPYYYRQFGYEYAIDLEWMRHVYIAALPSAPAGEDAPYALRPATEEDIPLLVELSGRERARWQVATVLDERAWSWMAFEADPAARTIGATYMITTAGDATIGYMLLSRGRPGDSLGIWGVAVREGAPLIEVAPHALRALRDLVLAGAFPSYRQDAPPLTRFRLEMGPGHALFDALGPDLAPLSGNRYAWYMRIPDVPAFIQHIAPALERRLAGSALDGHTGELPIDFYRGGVRLTFDRGKLVAADELLKPTWGEDWTHARFPPLVFTQLLLGYRSYADLSYAYMDAWAEGVERALLETLFPAQSAYMLPLS